jgi:hypothetical protein
VTGGATGIRPTTAAAAIAFLAIATGGALAAPVGTQGGGAKLLKRRGYRFVTVTELLGDQVLYR